MTYTYKWNDDEQKREFQIIRGFLPHTTLIFTQPLDEAELAPMIAGRYHITPNKLGVAFELESDAALAMIRFG